MSALSPPGMLQGGVYCPYFTNEETEPETGPRCRRDSSSSGIWARLSDVGRLVGERLNKQTMARPPVKAEL